MEPKRPRGPVHTAITREINQATNRDAYDKRREQDTPIPLVRSFGGTDQEFRDLIASYVLRKNEEAEMGMSLPDLYHAFEEHMAEHHSQPKQIAENSRIIAQMREDAARKPTSVPPMRDTMDTGSFKANIHDLEKELQRQREALQQYKEDQQNKMISEQKAAIVEFRDARKWYQRQGIVAGITVIVTVIAAWILSKLGIAPKP